MNICRFFGLRPQNDKLHLIIVVLLLFITIPSFACTSVIVSGKHTKDGKAVMFKHRDSSCQDVKVEYFQGEKYRMMCIVNADWQTHPLAKVPLGTREAWAGQNETGFAIMNTATYDLKDDDVPDSMMDCEGVFMYRALEICATLEDFEHYLDTLSRPMRVEANFGVIDNNGGAAYYEVNNHSWTKFDVNKEPLGYRVVTNFTMTGREKDRKGVDRYIKAYKILASSYVPMKEWDHTFFIKNISCSGKPILRDITSCAVVFEGDTMWASLGKPDQVPCLPYKLD